MNSVKNKTSVSLVVPAYNEEKRIATVLSQYCSHFPDSEIIVVCDGTDNTLNIVKSLSKDNTNIKLLHFDDRVGKGGAIIEGFKIASGDIIGFVDADNLIKPSQVAAMIDELSNADGVIASRHLNDSKIIVKQPLKRRFASKCFNIFVRLMFYLPFKDTQCGAKIFKNEAIAGMLNESMTTGFEFDVELLWKLKKKGCTIVEYPIEWSHSEGSGFSLKSAPKMFISLIRVRLWE
ncbi:MAG: glycosyltransferase family 2 protein [Methanosarcinaceae archaeon]|nr:glycosyltransferase family 2 protein [Methanosarcinaceae archaeon]